MPLKKGLWLTLIDDAGEATPVACDIAEQREEVWILDALVPPQVYPVTFVAARLRLDGSPLGMTQLPEPIVTVTHEPLEVRIEFPLRQDALARAEQRGPVRARPLERSSA